MIWIALILTALIVKYLYDKNKALENINSNGGLIVRYHTLITYMLSRSNGLITSHGRDHVNIDYYGKGLSVHFKIVPAFDEVIIKWEFKMPLIGGLKNKWEFHEGKVSQVRMVKIIDQDITIQSKPFLEVISPSESEIEENETEIEEELIDDTCEEYSQEDIDKFLEEYGPVKIPEVSLIDNPFHDIFRHFTVYQKALALSIFTQVKHNNYSVDSIVNIMLNDITEYEDYEEGLFFFQNLFNALKDDDFINDFLNLVALDLHETHRLAAICFSVMNNTKLSNQYLSLAEENWRAEFPYELRYHLILIKTKVDMLIYSKNYFEACTLCEEALERIEENIEEKIGWLKYQFSKTLVRLSSHIHTRFDIEVLTDQLEKMERDAENEDLSFTS